MYNSKKKKKYWTHRVHVELNSIAAVTRTLAWHEFRGRSCISRKRHILLERSTRILLNQPRPLKIHPSVPSKERCTWTLFGMASPQVTNIKSKILISISFEETQLILTQNRRTAKSRITNFCRIDRIPLTTLSLHRIDRHNSRDPSSNDRQNTRFTQGQAFPLNREKLIFLSPSFSLYPYRRSNKSNTSQTSILFLLLATKESWDYV